jgi:hypothetical protein
MKSALLLSCLLATPLLASAVAKPNVILIMVDDMGYSDIRPWGGEIDTPNIDALAKNGVPDPRHADDRLAPA